MHPKSIEIFEKYLVEGDRLIDSEEYNKFLNDMLSEEKVPNIEMAKLLFDETVQLIITYRRGVLDGVKKVVSGMPKPPSKLEE